MIRALSPGRPDRKTHPLLLIVFVAGCVTGAPGHQHPASDFQLYTAESPDRARSLMEFSEGFLQDLESYLDLSLPPGNLLRIYHYRWRLNLWRNLNRGAPSLPGGQAAHRSG